ncbi:MAG: SIR2 family protein [Kiritimatiellales bacterium]
MIDPMTTLAFSLYENKGVYAFLLGSGVSRAAGIPTGYEIMPDLIKKVAGLEGEEAPSDPEKWFLEKYGQSATYSNIIEHLNGTPEERRNFLKKHFEPTDEEHEQGLKLPTKAHDAIAQLVKDGFIKVIITTNFDRLIESALAKVGITPTVLSSPDQLAGAVPLVHSDVTVIKLHGDYLNSWMKNTDTELSEYDSETNKWLDRILDEYGLIVCGWSGDWDHALRAAIERCSNRRFSAFWTARGALTDTASKLATCRDAKIIRIQDADIFFESVRDKVQALSDSNARHPISKNIAIAQIKRYLMNPSSEIALKELLYKETERVYANISNSNLTTIKQRIQMYEKECDLLLSLIIEGFFWCKDERIKHFIRAIQQLISLADPYRSRVYSNLQKYPALLLFYGASLSAIADGNYSLLKTIFDSLEIRDTSGTYPFF